MRHTQSSGAAAVVGVNPKREKAMTRMTPQHAARRTNPTGFTLIEILIVVAIIALLAMILFPVFSRVRINGHRAACASNMKQIALAIHQYTQDYDERFPTDRPNPALQMSVLTQAPFTGSCTVANNCVRWAWPDLIFPYVKNAQVFNDASRQNQYFAGCTFYNGVACSTVSLTRPKYWIYQGPYQFCINSTDANDSQRTGVSYGYSLGLATGGSGGIPKLTSEIAYPSEYALLTESHHFQLIPSLAGSDCGNMIPRHFYGVNTAFSDGHVKWINWDTICTQYDVNESSKHMWMADGQNYP
jgi:prepilin-type N-terminal cleavage/methylation domain-containing protein/prepilin-type processing-associated H-X9-DG protein